MKRALDKKWYITIGILLLGIYLSGCSMFSMARMRAVVITNEDAVYGTIPGEKYVFDKWRRFTHDRRARQTI